MLNAGKKVRCIRENGTVNYMPYHLAFNAEYMQQVGLRVEDPAYTTFETKEETINEIKPLETTESIDVFIPNEIGNIFDNVKIEDLSKKKKHKLK